MKYKMLLVFILIGLFVSPPTWAAGIQTDGEINKDPVGSVSTDTNCNQALYYPIGKLCQDTDDGKLYKGTGSAVEEIAGGTGDVTGVGDCSTGACFDGSSDGGTYVSLYDAQGATKLQVGDNAGAITLTLPIATGTIPTIVSSIADSDLTKCPDGNSVFDALALKAPSTNIALTALANQAAQTVNANATDGAAAPTAVAISASQVVARLAAGNIKGASTAEMKTLLGYPTSGEYQATDTEITALAGLTFADVSLIQLTGAGTAAVLTCTANQLIGANSAGDALECKSTLNIATFNLPSADTDPATTAGQIKHDSSSTEADTAARGVVKWFDGTNVRTVVDTGTSYFVITKEEYLPIRYAEDDDTVVAPAAAAEIGTTGLIARSFTEDADNGVLFYWKVPNDYVGGIKFRVIYATDTNSGADETAVFSLSGCSVGNTDAITCAEGSAVSVTDELTADYDTGELIITDYSTEVTVTDIVAGEMTHLLLIRDISEDDMVGHALITGIDIKYKAKIIGFAGY